MSTHRRNLQPEDRTDTRSIARDKLESRIKHRTRKESREVEAYVRKLHREVENAIAGTEDTDRHPEALLEELHLYLWHDPGWPNVTHTDGPPSPATAYQFNQIHDRFMQGADISPDLWYEVLADVAKGLGYYHSLEDLTRYEPVRFSKIDPAPGKASTSGEVTPIGRIRIGADEPIGPGDRSPIIEHKSCEHILSVALPRQGKDSTNVSLCANLKEDHNYKWISLWDDGRDETNMIGIPNDEEPIRENLDDMGQEPKGFDTRVYVPAMSGLPSELPGNFEPFTIGVGDLTGKLILQLGGFGADRNTINRVEQALKDATNAKGDEVAVLVDRLEKYAEQVEATVTIRRLVDDDMGDEDVGEDAELGEDEHGATEIRYEMDADDVLHECAQTVLHLAAEGLLANSDADTNLDMAEMVRRNDRVATLNCNYLEDRNEPLKYVITNLWLRLLLRVRDEDKSLPRVALEVRELKQIAPSTMKIVDYSDEVRPLRQTLYEIATQGGSRRILMVGSTQKLNDVAKPVRSNMPYKIFLKLDNGLIRTMDDEMQFPYELKEQLKGFNQGQGALKADENFFWPIWWRGAPCGLGDGDVPFERRYGQAYGYRVRAYDRDRWRPQEEALEWWADSDGEVHEPDDPPEIDEWFLLSTDFPGCVGRESIDGETVKRFAERRQEYAVPNDLTFQRTSVAYESREMRLEDIERAKERQMAELFSGGQTATTDGGEELRLPAALRPWLNCSKQVLEKLTRCLVEIDGRTITSQSELSDYTGIPEGTISVYLSDAERLEACYQRTDSGYELTQIGETALEVDWSEVWDA